MTVTAVGYRCIEIRLARDWVGIILYGIGLLVLRMGGLLASFG